MTNLSYCANCLSVVKIRQRKGIVMKKNILCFVLAVGLLASVAVGSVNTTISTGFSCISCSYYVGIRPFDHDNIDFD